MLSIWLFSRFLSSLRPSASVFLLSHPSRVSGHELDILWLICCETFHSTCFFPFTKALLFLCISITVGKCQCLDINILQRTPPAGKAFKNQNVLLFSTLPWWHFSSRLFLFPSYLKNTAFILKSDLTWLQWLLGLVLSAEWVLFPPVGNQQSPEPKELRCGGSLPGAK